MGKVVFDGIDSSGKLGLWVTDGTPAGTHELMIAGANDYGLLPRFITPVVGVLAPELNVHFHA
jgi:hypothetical protein